jgi:hypothetical protein
MAHITLQLHIDPVSKKREVRIGYESDADALPMEHDEDHAAVVRRVVGNAPVSRVHASEGLLESVAEPQTPGGLEQKS